MGRIGLLLTTVLLLGACAPAIQAPVPAAGATQRDEGPALSGQVQAGLLPAAGYALRAMAVPGGEALALLPESSAGLVTDAQGRFALRLAAQPQGPFLLVAEGAKGRLECLVDAKGMAIGGPLMKGRVLQQAGGVGITPATTLVSRLMAPALRLAGGNPEATNRILLGASQLVLQVEARLSPSQSANLLDSLGAEGEGPSNTELRQVAEGLGLEALLREGVNTAFSGLDLPEVGEAGANFGPEDFPLGPPGVLVEAGLVVGLLPPGDPNPGTDPQDPNGEPTGPDAQGPNPPLDTDEPAADVTAQGLVQVEAGAVVNTQNPIGLRP